MWVPEIAVELISVECVLYWYVCRVVGQYALCFLYCCNNECLQLVFQIVWMWPCSMF